MDEFCVVNFANGGWYSKGQTRLEQSLIPFNHSFVQFNEYSQINCESHNLNPYSFKIYSILKARDMGYKRILWMDCSAWAIKSLYEIDKMIDNDGYFFEKGGEAIGNWTNDYTMNYFHKNRDDLMKVRIIIAGVCGFNFENEKAVKIFNEWKMACDNGCFKGSWNNKDLSESNDIRCYGHRHDLSCLSILAWDNSAITQEPNKYLQYVYPNIDTKPETYILLQGM
jgi:hypothetical protein